MGDSEVVKVLSVDEILQAKDFRDEVVPVPAWGGAVRVRTLPLRGRYGIVVWHGGGHG
jgi:hypothetical protein